MSSAHVAHKFLPTVVLMLGLICPLVANDLRFKIYTKYARNYVNNDGNDAALAYMYPQPKMKKEAQSFNISWGIVESSDIRSDIVW